MQNKHRLLGLLLLLLHTFFPCLDAAATVSDNSAYIIELSRPPSESTLSGLKARYVYDSDIFRGFAVEFSSEAEAKSVLEHEDVINSWPITHHTRPSAVIQNRGEKTSSAGLELFSNITAAELTKANYAYKQLNTDGSGIRIGIIDSGVDYKHPALGKCFGAGCKIAYGYDLVGNNYNGTQESIKESTNPFDGCSSGDTSATGHGTFVSGIIAADDKKHNWTGVAPGATLGMWRVFGCNYTGVGNDVLIKAFEMARKAEMNIINISLGNNGGWEEDAVAVVAERLVAKGIHVVVASGNVGNSGIFLTASPASARGVIAVGSSMNSQSAAFLSFVYPDTPQSKNPATTITITYRTMTNTALPVNSKMPIVFASSEFKAINDTCSPLKKTAKNSILVIHEGGCKPITKINHAKNAGAEAVILYSDTDDIASVSPVNGTVMNYVAFINSGDAHSIFTALNATAELTNQLVAVNSSEQDKDSIASFSTFGPTNELQLKPELTAVGGNVFSTLPAYRDWYGIMSGTSMSAPFISGSIALLLKSFARPLNPSKVKTALMNFANPVRPPILGVDLGDSPIRQGAGVINVAQAIQGFERFHVLPAQLSLNDTEYFEPNHVITIYNKQPDPLEITISHTPSLTVLGYSNATQESHEFIPSELVDFDPWPNTNAQLSFSSQTITIQPGQSGNVSIEVKPPMTAYNQTSHAIYGGYVKISGQNMTASVPYIGMIGKMSALPVLDRTTHFGNIASFPSIAHINGTILSPNSIGTFQPNNRPLILVRLATGTALVQIQVLRKNKVIGDVPMLPGGAPATRVYLQRNTVKGEGSTKIFYIWTWNGDYVHKDATLYGDNGGEKPRQVKDGVYRLKIRALRVFGDRKSTSAKDWDEWLSPSLQMVSGNVTTPNIGDL